MSPSPEPWLSLAYHTLAHIPLPHRDHASLHAPRYTRWYTSQHHLFASKDNSPRLLPDDAPLIAALYASSPEPRHLHTLPRLHNTINALLDAAPRPLSALPGAAPRQLARAGEELVELVRIALWSEVQSGFRTVHDAAFAPLIEQARAPLERWIARVCERLPVLEHAQWRFAPPLLRSGRLFHTPEGEPELHVGVPTDALEVPEWAPVLQGAHECLLHHATRLARHPRGPTTTRSGSSGYAAFLRPEMVALSAGARIFGDDTGELGGAWRAWIGRLYPEGTATLARSLPWDVELRGELCAVLARGQALAPSDAGQLETLVRSVT